MHSEELVHKGELIQIQDHLWKKKLRVFYLHYIADKKLLVDIAENHLCESILALLELMQYARFHQDFNLIISPVVMKLFRRILISCSALENQNCWNIQVKT